MMNEKILQKQDFCEDLVLEVTRKCNMCCDHCLRGDAEEKDMPEEVAFTALSSFSEIGTITFSGGEPFLNKKLICSIVEFILDKKIKVNNFFIATNGMIYDEEIIKSLEKLYNYINCIDLDAQELLPYGNVDDLYCNEDFFGSITVSRDFFHDEIPLSNYVKFSKLPFFTKDKDIFATSKVRSIEENFKYLIPEGRSYEFGLTDKKAIKYVSNVESEKNGYITYVNVDGYVFSDCNLSYNSQKESLSVEAFRFESKGTKSALKKLKNMDPK